MTAKRFNPFSDNSASSTAHGISPARFAASPHYARFHHKYQDFSSPLLSRHGGPSMLHANMIHCAKYLARHPVEDRIISLARAISALSFRGWTECAGRRDQKRRDGDVSGRE